MASWTNRGRTALIFAAAFALYFFSRSPGLDEWDSIQFAFGAQHFDLWQDQPHPPGYPLFVLFGWLARVLFSWSPVFSLHVASALGGALLVAMWFLIVREQFGERFAWLVAVTLAVMPIVWMTSTKVMTDSLAAGLFSAQLLFAFRYRRDGATRDWLWMALLGAATAGVRPQLTAIVLVLMATALWQRGASPRVWGCAYLVFFAAAFAWLLPMWFLQWRLRPDFSFWQVYPHLLFRQWHWRLTQPEFYVGAGGWDAGYLAHRLREHLLGWFEIGFGFSFSYLTMAVGALLAALGLTSYVRRAQGDWSFWRLNLPWAVVHVVIIFCSLPWDQRYYLPIFPLLIVALALGLYRLPQPWPWLTAAWPALLLAISWPLALANATDTAPPIKFAEFLKERHPPAERAHVLVITHESQRHLQWYAPGFDIVADVGRLTDLDPVRVEGAAAIYTDEENLRVAPDWRLVPLQRFERTELISPKQDAITVFRVVSTNSEVGEQIILKRGPGK